MDKIIESLETPIVEKSDIIVVGGGVAGISAALAASRMGCNVLLLEKSIVLGGLATLGLINWYEPICDGCGEKLITGIAYELLRLSILYGPDELPEIWKEDNKPFNKALVSKDKHDKIGGRYATHFSPTIFSLALDELLLHQGVKVRLDILAAHPVMEHEHCLGVVCESKSGRECFIADEVIDATGDADIIFRAGMPCVEGKNYLTFIAQGCNCEQAKSACENKNLLGIRRWMAVGSDLHGNGHPDDYPYMAGVQNEEVTKFVFDGRRLLLDKIRKDNRMLRDVLALPSMAQFRTTRRLEGEYVLSEADVGKVFNDSIGLIGDFEVPGDWFEIPWRCLYHSSFDNLLAAGRIISAAQGRGWDVTRVIPAAALTGQAAGIAAALMISCRESTNTLSVKRLQKSIEKQGVRLHKT